MGCRYNLYRVANTAQTVAEAAGNVYHGSHPAASTVTVMGNTNGEPAFIQIRNIAPARSNDFNKGILINTYQAKMLSS